MSDERSPLDAALDLMLFAPVGLVITAAEQLPGFAEKGRARVGSRVTAAGMVGRLAVAQGSRELARRRSNRADQSAGYGSSKPGSGQPQAGEKSQSGPLKAGIEAGAGNRAQSAKRVGSSAAARSGDVGAPRPQIRRTEPTRPSGDKLAIPGYDSLSASQVVSRLAGLTSPELEEVAAYEAANRGRRTVMTRIRQLQG